MNSISSMGSGLSPSHLQLLLDNASGDDRGQGIGSARQGQRATKIEPVTDTSDAQAVPPEAAGSGGDLLTKINALIETEQSSGRLSQDRATAIRDVFSKAFTPAADTASATVSTLPAPLATAPATGQPQASSSGESSAPQDVGSILNDFLKLLQGARSSASTYGASGNFNSTARPAATRLVNVSA